MVTDEHLLAAYKGGDQQGLRELVVRYERELFAFLARFVADHHAAQDLFQETFIQVHRNAASFDPQRRFRPWLFTIAANKARDFLRAHGRRTTFSLDNVTGRGSDNSASASGDQTFVDLLAGNIPPPPSQLAHAEDLARVSAVLAALSDSYREILTLAFFHDFSYQDIADMLHIPLGTVKSRLHAATAAFAKSYKSAAHNTGAP